jgi:oligopeptide transport system permease protein
MNPVGARKAQTLERAFAGRSLWADARARLFRNKAAVAGMMVLGIVAFLALRL